MLAAIFTPSAVTFHTANGPVSYGSDTPAYAEALNIYYAVGTSDDDKELALADLHRRGSLSLAAAARRLSENLNQNINGDIFYKGFEIPKYVAGKLKELIGAGLDHLPLVRFIENLMLNPSNSVLERLYTFLEYGKNPLTSDGCFLAYKAVRPDYLSIAAAPDGTHLDNHIGCTPEMPRNQVDENQDNTCSSGLHVCSFEYLPSFAHANGHVMVVKVNPRDVVAIPRDYNNTKMRCCRYEVVGEVEGWYEQRENLLARDAYNDTYDADFSDTDIDDGDDWDNTRNNDGVPRNWAVRCYHCDGSPAFELEDLTETSARELFSKLRDEYETVQLFENTRCEAIS